MSPGWSLGREYSLCLLLNCEMLTASDYQGNGRWSDQRGAARGGDHEASERGRAEGYRPF